MLFVFNKFWKSVVFLSASLLSLSFVGFEFTAIVLLSLLYCSNFETKHTHI
mgnify:CR=1 FL=1